ncbi:16S rRNA (uracil(1498)-N(3))-methyltransferase [Halomonas sp. WWR20]
MAAPRIHVESALDAGATLILPESAARHVALVLRLREGATLTLFDGRGVEAHAELITVARKQVAVRIREVFTGQRESPLAVHLGQAISKGDRMDYAIQKAVELGVAVITPLYTEHGDVRLKGEREAKKLAHWQGVAISACEQCGRAVVPVINAPQPLAEWLSARDEPLRLALHPATESAFARQAHVERAALLIGPEGGLSPTEVDVATAAGFTPLTLGPRILRTETAPVVALTLLQYHFGDLGVS